MTVNQIFTYYNFSPSIFFHYTVLNPHFLVFHFVKVINITFAIFRLQSCQESVSPSISLRLKSITLNLTAIMKRKYPLFGLYIHYQLLFRPSKKPKSSPTNFEIYASNNGQKFLQVFTSDEQNQYHIYWNKENSQKFYCGNCFSAAKNMVIVRIQLDENSNE